MTNTNVVDMTEMIPNIADIAKMKCDTAKMKCQIFFILPILTPKIYVRYW